MIPNCRTKGLDEKNAILVHSTKRFSLARVYGHLPWGVGWGTKTQGGIDGERDIKAIHIQVPSLSFFAKLLCAIRFFSSSNFSALDMVPPPDAANPPLRGSPPRRGSLGGGPRGRSRLLIIVFGLLYPWEGLGHSGGISQRPDGHDRKNRDNGGASQAVESWDPCSQWNRLQDSRG